MKPTSRLFALALLAVAAGAQAQVRITDAWVRGTVAQQKATGAFMRLQADTDTRLVGVRSPLAGVSEVHEVAMNEGVMTMRALADGLELPKGQPVELKPGGYHVMLMELKRPLKAGERVPLTLTFRDAGTRREYRRSVLAPVRALGAAADGASAEHVHVAPADAGASEPMAHHH